VRVYIPATLTILQKLVADGSMHARSGTAFAVTPTLRESYSEGDDDELAEMAIEGPDTGLPPRRAVLVAEVDGATARPDLDDAVVRLAGPVGMADVVAAYLDNAAAEPAVMEAIEAVDAADLGDEDSEFTVGDAQDHDLAWYASQELPFLLDLL
jgi:hypothetical protein